MKTINWLMAVAVGLSLSSTGWAAKAELAASDKAFITDAAEGGLAEVKMGEAAGKQGSNAKVKALGKHLVTDHTKANAELAKIAKSKGVDVPTEPGLIQQGKLKLLEMKDGKAFDEAFVEAAVKDHETTIKAFEDAEKDSADADIKAFAKKTLPTLKMHLEMAKAAEKALGEK